MKQIEENLLAHLNEFVGFARKRLLDPELAADAVQESLLKALKGHDELRSDESAKAWFYRILRRTIIDLYRRQAARQKTMERVAVEEEVALDAETEKSLCACLRKLLPTLKPEYSDVIDKVDLNGRDIQSVATELGIKPNNLKVRLHRGRAQLRERLEETCRMCAKHGCLDCSCDSPENSTESHQ